MNRFRILAFCFLLMSCGQKPDLTVVPAKDTVVKPLLSPSPAQVADTNTTQETATYYLVQVATGYNYDSLAQIARNAAGVLHSRFDQLERTYKPNKGIVVLDSSEDEIFRGEYYPRRPFDDQNFVSVEMMNYYRTSFYDTLQMVVFANILKDKRKADSVTGLLKSRFPEAVTVKQDLYLGCMH